MSLARRRPRRVFGRISPRHGPAAALLVRLAEEALRDPGLTFDRFAPRLGLPAKPVSSALAAVPPHHFRARLNDIRIGAAVDALRSGWDRPLTELAMEVG